MKITNWFKRSVGFDWFAGLARFDISLQVFQTGVDLININTKNFWDDKFATGQWDDGGGRKQTQDFAEKQTQYIKLGKKFSGKILDFGCGLGDAFSVYRSHYPLAELIGLDFSPIAIEKCESHYGDLASFVCLDHRSCPSADVIIVSNVLEHLDDDQGVARSLFSKCRDLYVIVPYREQFLVEEHVRAYDKNSFDILNPQRIKVFSCKGWSEYDVRRVWWEIRGKNLLRPFFGKTQLRRRLQIMYHFHNSDFKDVDRP